MSNTQILVINRNYTTKIKGFDQTLYAVFDQNNKHVAWFDQASWINFIKEADTISFAPELNGGVVLIDSTLAGTGEYSNVIIDNSTMVNCQVEGRKNAKTRVSHCDMMDVSINDTVKKNYEAGPKFSRPSNIKNSVIASVSDEPTTFVLVRNSSISDCNINVEDGVKGTVESPEVFTIDNCYLKAFDMYGSCAGFLKNSSLINASLTAPSIEADYSLIVDVPIEFKGGLRLIKARIKHFRHFVVLSTAGGPLTYAYRGYTQKGRYTIVFCEIKSNTRPYTNVMFGLVRYNDWVNSNERNKEMREALLENGRYIFTYMSAYLTACPLEF